MRIKTPEGVFLPGFCCVCYSLCPAFDAAVAGIYGLQLEEPVSWMTTRIASFGYAMRGVWQLFSQETHAQIHLLATVLVLVAGFITGLQRWEWVALIVCIALVVALEGMNTALEALADALHPGHHPMVGKAKDVAAGAVLVCALAAVVVACLVFLPHWL